MTKSRGSRLEEFYFDKNNLTGALNTHLALLTEWSSAGPFSKPAGSEWYLTPNLKKGGNISGSPAILSPGELLKDDESYNIVGNVGSGKTTLVKHMIYDLLHQSKRAARIPLLILGRDIKQDSSIIKELYKIFNLNQDTERSAISPQLATVLQTNHFLLFIDGIDEIYMANRQKIEFDISLIKKSINGIKLIITSRPYFAEHAESKDIQNVYITPFDSQQAGQLLGMATGDKGLYTQLLNSPYKDFLSSPLLVSLLASLYNRNQSLPENRIDIFRSYIRYSLEKWDSLNDILRQDEPSSRLAILSLIAFLMSREHLMSITTKELKRIIDNSSKHQFKSSGVEYTLQQVSSNSGLIIETAPDTWKFVHKSLMEVLAAEYLIKSPAVPFRSLISEIPEIIALCVLFSSDPVYYFAVICDTVEDLTGIEQYMMVCINKLLAESSATQKSDFENILFMLRETLLSNSKSIYEDLLNLYYH